MDFIVPGSDKLTCIFMNTALEKDKMSLYGKAVVTFKQEQKAYQN
jgi:hypothetical protein